MLEGERRDVGGPEAIRRKSGIESFGSVGGGGLSSPLGNSSLQQQQQQQQFRSFPSLQLNQYPDRSSTVPAFLLSKDRQRNSTSSTILLPPPGPSQPDALRPTASYSALSDGRPLNRPRADSSGMGGGPGSIGGGPARPFSFAMWAGGRGRSTSAGGGIGSSNSATHGSGGGAGFFRGRFGMGRGEGSDASHGTSKTGGRSFWGGSGSMMDMQYVLLSSFYLPSFFFSKLRSNPFPSFSLSFFDRQPRPRTRPREEPHPLRFALPIERRPVDRWPQPTLAQPEQSQQKLRSAFHRRFVRPAVRRDAREHARIADG
jgi:hypothetical protein